MGTGRKKPEFGVREAAIPAPPPPPAPALSAPRAPSTARAPPPQGCGAAAEGPRGWVPPAAFLLPLCPHGAQTSSRSSAGTCRDSPHSPLRCRTTTTPEPAWWAPACRATQVPCAPPSGPSCLPARAPLTKKAGRDVSFWRPSGHGAPPHPSAPSSGHTVPSLGDIASTRLPFSALTPRHSSSLRSPVLTPTSVALPLAPQLLPPTSIALPLSRATLTPP